MTKKIGIVVSLVLALVFTILIINTANKNYRQVAQKVQVALTQNAVPAGSKITPDDVKAVEVYKSAAQGLAPVEEAVGKAAKVSMIGGQYVYRDALEPGGGLLSGYVEVFVPVELASSALAAPGQAVDVHIVSKEKQSAPALIKGVRVLHAVDSQGNAVGLKSGSSPMEVVQNNGPAAVGLAIPQEQAEAVVLAASQKTIYLTRVTPE